LVLLRRGIAHAHGRGTSVTRQPIQGELRQAPLSVDAVHDLHLLRSTSDGAQQPFSPRAGFVLKSAAEERVQNERGVAQPREPVVPVAYAAEPLWEGGGGGSDRPARRGVGEGLQGDERADDRIPPRASVGAAAGPVSPPGF